MSFPISTSYKVGGQQYEQRLVLFPDRTNFDSLQFCSLLEFKNKQYLFWKPWDPSRGALGSRVLQHFKSIFFYLKIYLFFFVNWKKSVLIEGYSSCVFEIPVSVSALEDAVTVWGTVKKLSDSTEDDDSPPQEDKGRPLISVMTVVEFHRDLGEI